MHETAKRTDCSLCAAARERDSGLPLFYATAMTIGGYARGLMVESHLNRPTKVEGNPDHPASLGATAIFEQASVLNLYDPDRSESVLHEGRLSTWSEFTGSSAPKRRAINLRKGEGLAILDRRHDVSDAHEPDRRYCRAIADAKWYVHEPSVNPRDRKCSEKDRGSRPLLSPMTFLRPT